MTVSRNVAIMPAPAARTPSKKLCRTSRLSSAWSPDTVMPSGATWGHGHRQTWLSRLAYLGSKLSKSVHSVCVDSCASQLRNIFMARSGFSQQRLPGGVHSGRSVTAQLHGVTVRTRGVDILDKG